MKIGIYGGSFNPPHLGHMAAAKAAVEALKLDRLLIVPACDPPHKKLPEGSATPKQRLEMAAIMADQLPCAQCWDVEMRRDGVSYTVDTLEEAKRLWPEDELWLLVGTDMFLSLQSWCKPERIMELAGICITMPTSVSLKILTLLRFLPQRSERPLHAERGKNSSMRQFTGIFFEKNYMELLPICTV